MMRAISLSDPAVLVMRCPAKARANAAVPLLANAVPPRRPNATQSLDRVMVDQEVVELEDEQSPL
jgi:hypothetical protein